MNHLPRLPRPPSPANKSIHFSPVLAEVAQLETGEVFARMQTAPEGLSEVEAGNRLMDVGPNVVATNGDRGWPRRLFVATRNPLVILLTVLATISFATGDARAGTVITLMVILGVLLRFVQETRAGVAAAKLKAMINVTAAVVRAGEEEEIPLKNLVPGDVVELSAGDMIPADVRLIAANDLFISQGTLTGESLPVEKLAARETRTGIAPLEFTNICFLGTSVESGAATAVVLATGAQTYFGSMAGSMAEDPEPTSFDKGVQQFTWLMLRFMLVMVPLVFLINGLTKHNWHEAFFFSIAVAVGLTPEMLPMIVSVCLSKGALAMSRQKVIVKQLSSIFDYTTFFVMLYAFGCWDPARASLFQTGWFVESLITQTLIVHVIRTNKIPFIQGRASWQLTMTTVTIMAFAAWLPHSPLAPALGFTALPPLYWPILLATLLCYVVLTQAVKMWLIRKAWL